jgi:hypothetical protein
MMKNFVTDVKRLGLIALALFPLFILTVPSAQATVTITPMLILIEGRTRFADVNLLNMSDETNSYTIGWKFMKMIEGGGYELADKSLTDFDLTKHIVFTPRKVTIEPKGLQKIRLAMRLNGEPPPPGDYRAHLELKEASAPPEPTPLNPSETGQKRAKIGVEVHVGFSIPVVFRVGESDATAQIGDVKTQLNEKSGRIEALFPITRSGGPFGLLGHVLVYYNGEVVGEIKNANIFSEVSLRNFKIPLTVKELSGGSLRIVYKHYDKKNDTIFAEKTVPVGN